MQYEKETDMFLINGSLVSGNDVEDILYNHVKSAMDSAKERVVIQTQGEHMKTEEAYLGDGVYASFDGYQIWLAVNHHENNVVALDPSVFARLCDYVEKLNENT